MQRWIYLIQHISHFTLRLIPFQHNNTCFWRKERKKEDAPEKAIYFLGVMTDAVASLETLVKQNLSCFSVVFCLHRSQTVFAYVDPKPDACWAHLLRCWVQSITASPPAKATLSSGIEKVGSGHVRAYSQPSWGVLELIAIPQIRQVVSA